MQQQRLWVDSDGEPSIDDLLAEPIVRALMEADGVTSGDVVSAIARSDSGSLSIGRSRRHGLIRDTRDARNAAGDAGETP